MLFDETFPHSYTARELPQPILVFGAVVPSGALIAIEVMSREESWTGVFYDSLPIEGRAGMFSCPNQDELCLLSGSNAYVFNTARARTHSPQLFEGIVDAFPIRATSTLVLVGVSTTMGLGESGVQWTSARLCDDELSLCSENDGIVKARGFSHGVYVDFELDSRTGLLV